VKILNAEMAVGRFIALVLVVVVFTCLQVAVVSIWGLPWNLPILVVGVGLVAWAIPGNTTDASKRGW
jgi:hypothetical protein